MRPQGSRLGRRGVWVVPAEAGLCLPLTVMQRVIHRPTFGFGAGLAASRMPQDATCLDLYHMTPT
tara:strand:- start:27263 stop:27457 length:195 start_codon:yes stop_codon:yes gene_type:complete